MHLRLLIRRLLVQAIYLFYIAKEEAELTNFKTRDALEKEVKGLIRAEVGAFAAPDNFHWARTGLPKTRSGKIMRRILRKIAVLGPMATSDDLGDTSTLAEPTVVNDLMDTHADAGTSLAT